MLEVDDADILAQTEMIEKKYEEGSGTPLLFSSFLKKAFRDDKIPQYPMTVKIAPTISDLLQAEPPPDNLTPEELRNYFTPSQVIVLDTPPTSPDGQPLWFNTTAKEINLRGFGYRNGDSRYISKYKLAGTTSHLIIAGASGQGKSVTVNSLIGNATTEYPPWELNLTMVDAKVAEFMKYYKEKSLPHISFIAATSDPDYIISVLEEKEKEMMLLNSALGKLGLSNIWTFREKFGMVIPRNWIIVDEFQTMLKAAQNKAKKVASILDSFARLGRNTGYHLTMCSQEPEGIDSATINNMGLRAALGCSESVSTKILGNGEGVINKNLPGRVIVNAQPEAKDKKHNDNFRGPFIDDSDVEKNGAMLHDLAKKYKFSRKMQFYNENLYDNQTKYSKRIAKYGGDPLRVHLGDPSFVLQDDDGSGMLHVDFTGKDIENLLVWCSNRLDVQRFLTMLRINFETSKGKAFHNIFTSDNELAELAGLGEICSDVKQFRSASDAAITSLVVKTYYRLFCLETDKLVFADPRCDQRSDTLFYSLFEKGGTYDTITNRYRLFHMQELITGDIFTQAFGLKNAGRDVVETTSKRIMKENIPLFTNWGAANEKLVQAKLKPIFNWFVGMEKVLGWGRQGNQGYLGELNRLLIDSSAANVKFIMTTTDFEELTPLKTGIQYCILDKIRMIDSKKVGLDEYPDKVMAVLSVFYDRYSPAKEALKFKRMAFDGEVISN